MRNIRRYAEVTIKDWVLKGDKIYLLTEDGSELMYVGRYGQKDLLMKAQKGRSMTIGINPEATQCAILDDIIQYQLR